MTAHVDPWDDGPLAEFALTLRSQLHAATAPATPAPEESGTRSAVLGLYAAAQRPSRLPHRLRARRGAVVAALATGLLVVTLGTTLATGPGRPLYQLRLDVEAAALPWDPLPREAAQVQRLDERVAEVRAAQAAGDLESLQASLMALAQIADDTAATAVPDQASRDRVVQQVRVLRSLGIDSERSGVALDAALQACARLESALGGPSDAPTTPAETAAPAAPAPTRIPAGTSAPWASHTPATGGAPGTGPSPSPRRSASPAPAGGQGGGSEPATPKPTTGHSGASASAGSGQGTGTGTGTGTGQGGSGSGGSGGNGAGGTSAGEQGGP